MIAEIALIAECYEAQESNLFREAAAEILPELLIMKAKLPEEKEAEAEAKKEAEAELIKAIRSYAAALQGYDYDMAEEAEINFSKLLHSYMLEKMKKIIFAAHRDLALHQLESPTLENQAYKIAEQELEIAKLKKQLEKK